MSEKVKVLYFVDRLLRGGIQTFVYENIKHMDRNKVQIDFLLLDDGNKYEMEDDLKELGCNIYKLSGIWLDRVSSFLIFSLVSLLNLNFSKSTALCTTLNLSDLTIFLPNNHSPAISLQAK